MPFDLSLRRGSAYRCVHGSSCGFTESARLCPPNFLEQPPKILVYARAYMLAVITLTPLQFKALSCQEDAQLNP